MNRHTIQELYQWQALPLNIKIRMTKRRIRDWVDEYGEDGVYVSFSGGKDSTVLLHIARDMYPNIKACFIDTGLEYPEIRAFVKNFENVDIIKPKMGFKKIVEKYGFPLISKEVCENVYNAKEYLESVLCEIGIDSWTVAEVENSEKVANILNERMRNKTGGNNQRLAIMLGMLTKDQTIKANMPKEERSRFSKQRWKFLLDAPFKISNRCCNVMKKEPAHRYRRETGRVPIIGTMASESKLRTQKWLQNGCNAFHLRSPISQPMSFWTEQDVLLYIQTHNIPLCSVYGDIVVDYESMGVSEGQMSIDDYCDMEEIELDRPLLKTTGQDRTGCIMCGFGCHMEKGEGRFKRLERTHPKVMQVFDVVQNSGITYREAIDWINKHNGKGEIIKMPSREEDE